MVAVRLLGIGLAKVGDGLSKGIAAAQVKPT
jgi:hypothetical protein